MTQEEFIAKLKGVGMTSYHDKHPFHKAMNEGKLNREQLKGWVANRYYYQSRIPLKDAAILSNCPLREVRRLWLHRITDHDGKEGAEGGIEAWLKLGEAVGFKREEILSETHVVPGVRFAVDAYVNLTRTKPWPIAISSSLTELFAPDLMKNRIEAFEKYYAWVPSWGLDYFKGRVTRAKSDSDEGLRLTLQYCDTPEMQEEAVKALAFKCDLLWALLDAISVAYGFDLKV
jgi:pyrroloquinoline-quinone synthase